MRSVLVLGDVHFPFTDEEALDKAIALAKAFQPELIVQMGDLYDLYAFSKYPRSLNLMTPEHELERAEDMAREMWHRLQDASPKSRCVQLKGNHDARAQKRAMENFSSSEHIIAKELRRMMTFDGVETVFDEREEWVFDDVLYQHGYRKHGDHAKYNQMSTVCGHLHLGGVTWLTNMNGPYFELNAGWLGDKRCPVFDYRCQKKLCGTTVGVGIIDLLGPRFVSLE